MSESREKQSTDKPINSSERKSSIPEDQRRTERASRVKKQSLITGPQEIADQEARNGLLQFDETRRVIHEAVSNPAQRFRLKPSFACRINRLATQGLIESPGVYRSDPIEISDTEHEPPPPEEVAELMEDMCDYVNSNWDKSPIHLASYVMWRLNWIHPFSDGNGRTSRAVSYTVLCVRLGYELPGTNTVPDQISDDKFPYYDALDAADAAWKVGDLNVSEMEKLLSGCLAKQLVQLHDLATKG